MAGRDPTRPQLEFPSLVAELITQLRLTGQLGRLNFSDEVVPAFLIGSRGINFSGDLPPFTSAATFSGFISNPLASTVIVTTGPLPAGTYDIMASVDVFGTIAAGNQSSGLEHRNAADTATLATLVVLGVSTTDHTLSSRLPLTGYVLGLNERLRVLSPPSALTGSIAAVIFAQIRPTP